MNNSLDEKKRKLAELLSNKAWRMSNLYYCKDENGKEFKFICNEAQSELINETHPLNIILKARQLGITTFYCINFLDDCLFNSNITAVLIGDDLEDAKKLLRDKVRYAYDRLPSEIKEHRKLLTDSTEIMRFSNGSSYSVTTSARSGTVQRLHITEFGKICRKSPEKAEEIMSGSLNTVHQGQQIVIESTAQ
ncbi:MAG: terminase, partial [Proteobacteria bacterium]|nr:terminase [Candidatus Fonsibacter lacus]